ncbi:MAG: hypothetical protein HGA31_05020 [Candidatus Moranbacteria bacterium]|nr:hypothetical protein [Candidatus Moranbacteria bacterium]
MDGTVEIFSRLFFVEIPKIIRKEYRRTFQEESKNFDASLPVNILGNEFILLPDRPFVPIERYSVLSENRQIDIDHQAGVGIVRHSRMVGAEYVIADMFFERSGQSHSPTKIRGEQGALQLVVFSREINPAVVQVKREFDFVDISDDSDREPV